MGQAIGFLVISLLYFGVWGLPSLNTYLRTRSARRIECDFESERIDPQDYSRPTQEIIAAVEGLGFRPLGVKVERPAGGSPVQELAYASEERGVFASIHSMHREQPHLYFFTPFKDGAIALTGDLQMQPVRAKDFLHHGVPGGDREEQLRLHLRAVEKFEKAGHRPFKRFDRDSRLRATDAYYAHPAAQGLMKNLGQKGLKDFLWSLGVVALAVAVLVFRLLK